MDDPSTIFQLFRDGSSWVDGSYSRTQYSVTGEARTNPQPLGLRWMDRYIDGWIWRLMDEWMDRYGNIDGLMDG